MLHRLRRVALATMLVAALTASSIVTSAAQGETSYTVTFENLTTGQPMSPIVAATSPNGFPMFRVGKVASEGIEAIAEDGDNSLVHEQVANSRFTTDVVNVGAPLATSGDSVTLPDGTVVTDTVSFEIVARPRDRLSLATMLICTNDGFTGLDRVKLPKSGSATYFLVAYDANTEHNTEVSGDIVDPCSLLGPEMLDGDPNGNDNASVDIAEPMRIIHHPGIAGGGDLSPDLHGWSEPVAMVTITVN